MDDDSLSREGYSNNAKIQAAAYENWQYARENGLVLSLETAKQLECHRGTAEAVFQSLSPEEKSLSHEHLKLLRIPPVSITEQWSVPSRIAAIIENACGCPSDDRLRQAEDELCARPRQKSLWMEQPLLPSDHDEDFAELRRTVSDTISSDIIHVRKHCLPVAEDDGLAIPQQADEFATGIEETTRTETMAVSEQTIRSMVQMINSMKQTDDDQANLVHEQLEYKPVSTPTVKSREKFC